MRLAALLMLALSLSLPLSAAAALPEARTKYAAEITAVEKYLNEIRTLKARFIQTAPNGQQVAGTFLMRRPGRMRFDYDPPVTDFIVADGMFIHYYDGEMKQGSRTLISQSLANFFLRKDLSLSGDLDVTDVQRGGGLLMVSLAQTDDKGAGTLVLGFAEKPALELKKWRIVDAEGSITEVELFETRTGLKLDKDLFHYYDPNLTKPRYN